MSLILEASCLEALASNLEIFVPLKLCCADQTPDYRVRIQTTNTSTPVLEGTIYTVCPITSLLALSTGGGGGGSGAKATYHIVPFASLTNFTILAPSTSTAPPPPPPLKTSVLQARANAALNRAKEKASRINKEVSKEGQEIFDALYRQFPGTRWAGKDMVVLDAVLIKGPGYRVEDCAANGKEGQGPLGRVKKVVSLLSISSRRQTLVS